jgi:Tol biopolymer transport system component
VSRRILLISGAALILVAAAAAVGLALTRDDDDSPSLPGRIAVVDGCGLRHMWPDGTDRRRLCLKDIWASASLSFDGRKLAWDTNASSAFGIMVADADGTNESALPVPQGVNVEPTLSPDTKRLAFLHSPVDDGRYDVWETSTSASSDVAEQVTAVRNVSFVAWSPKGDWLVYVKNWSEDTLEGDVVLVHPDGDDERSLGKGDEPAWAPDGKRIVLTRGGNLWTVALDGSKRLLVRNGRAPAWSRDGKQIAFMREEKCGAPSCKERVFLVFTDGREPRAVGPSFSPGRRVLWLPDPHE